MQVALGEVHNKADFVTVCRPLCFDLGAKYMNLNKQVDQLFKMLSWKNDEATQRRGIDEAKALNGKYLSILIQYTDVDAGDNCAKALSELPDKVLEPYLPCLLEWLQDMNWPGAWIILERLKSFVEPKVLAKTLEKSVRVALMCDDQHWLKSMSELLDNERLNTEISKDIADILYARYHWYDNE